MKKRLIATLLALSMLLSILPAQVFALAGQAESEADRNPFGDVSASDWFYEDVMYALENGLFAGITDSSFDPYGEMSRGMYVTVMGRVAEIEPEDYREQVFDDVDPDSWYGPYVAWAVEQGITLGVGDGRFDPDSPINREQMATLTVRFFDAYEIPYPEPVTDSLPKDIEGISDYALEAVTKLWNCGLFQGDDQGNFNPTSKASRAEAATFCTRTDETVEQWFVDTGVKEPVPTEEVTVEEGKQPISSTPYYTFKFVTNDGTTISDRSIRRGTQLDSLPIPYKADHIFVGWCYDEELTDLVEFSDTATESCILYAKYEQLGGISQESYTPTAVSIDSDADFSIIITASEEMSLADFKKAVTLKNLSSNQDLDWFVIDRSTDGKTFTITGLNYPMGGDKEASAGFVEGSAYKITLEDEDLTFDGQDASARGYDFTIKKTEVVNTQLNANLKEIPLSSISNLTVNGTAQSTISLPVITVGTDGDNNADGITVGSFDLSATAGGSLTVGDTVLIYAGVTAPTMEAVGGEDSAFVEITKATGNHYEYKSAQAEQVIFTPDVLPVSETADTDEVANQITVPVSAMTFTDDKFALAGLDATTTIDVGDFISFYTGTLQEDGTIIDGTTTVYGEITAVTLSGDSYVITYDTVDFARLQSAMTSYKKETLSGDELLDGADKEAIEQSVENQAVLSGFAQEAAMYLGALALETDSFEKIDDKYDLTAVQMQMDGQLITQETLVNLGASKPEVELSTVHADLLTTLVHFEGLSGLRLCLEIGATITFETDKADIEIEITGIFEQEVRVDIGVDGDAVWKWWGIFPYIAEYEVTAYAEFYTYTGIGISATITTKEHDEDPDNFGTDDEGAENFAKEIKDLMENKDKYDGEGDATVASSLEEKYSDMLENESDWVNLYEKDLVELSWRIILIIEIEFKITFVISANMNISLGVDFYYENAKRYVYTIEIFDKNVRNETINLVPEHYEFEFYIMGTMGMRIGIQVSITAGLFSTDFASVGFTAEAGAYIRLWGYFYYHYSWTEAYTDEDGDPVPEETLSEYAGALLFEVGVYLEITFEAQAFKGTFSYNPTLYENEWPLYRAGAKDNVRTFAYEQKEAPEIGLKAYVTTVQVPDSIFEMAYMDMKEGLDDGEFFTAIYDDKTPEQTDLVGNNGSQDDFYFKVSMTNPAFSYNPKTNQITVDPGTGADGKENVVEEGEMILTWKAQPLAFTSEPIQMRIPLYWDNLRDGYVIVPYTDGGSYLPIMVKKYQEKVTPPENPTKAGYDFGGWFQDEDLTTAYTFPELMPDDDCNIYAKWNPASDTVYTVNHYLRTLGTSEYSLYETDRLQGITDSTVTPDTKTYTGYLSPAQEELVIQADGSAVLNYYYDQQVHTVTFLPGEAGGSEVVISLKYGSSITAPVFAVEGYIFDGWDKDVQLLMLEENLTYTAQWTKSNLADYRVEYYVQQPDGRYVLQEMVREIGTTGQEIDVTTLMQEKYVETGVTSYENCTVGGSPVTNPTITGDGKTVIKVNYVRNQYTVTFKPENGSADIVYTLYSGAEITPPTVTKLGYNSPNWGTVAEKVGTSDLEYTATWTADTDTSYIVNHYQQNANDDSYALVDTESLTGTTDTTATATDKAYTNFNLVGTTATGNIDGGDSLVLENKYDRDTFTVTYYTQEGTQYGDSTTYKHGATVTLPAAPTQAGYGFGGWFDGETQFTGDKMPTKNLVLMAKWIPDEVSYTVKHSVQNPNDDLYTDTAETFTAIAGTEVTPSVKDYDTDEFTSPASQTVAVQGDSTTVVTYVYDRKTYDLSWDFAGGTASDSYTEAGSLKFGATITVPVLSKEGYTFDNWDTSPATTMGTSALEYTASWTANSYTVVYNANGGTGTMDSQDFTYNIAQILTANSFTRTGYTFQGWSTRSTATSATYADKASVENLTATANGTVTLYAVWTPVTYSIEYVNGNGTSNPTTYTIESGGITLDDAPAKTGYTFMGWYKEEACTNEVTGVAIATGSTLNKTFYAKWTAISYGVNYDDGTESANVNGDMSSSSFTYDQIATLASNEFGVTGYTFKGWGLAPNSDVVYTNGQAVEDNDLYDADGAITLYAQWEADSYNIAYSGVGTGATGHSNPTSYNIETADIALADPTGITAPYQFLGWFDANDNKVTSITKGSTGAVSLTAKWAHPGIFAITNVAVGSPTTFTVTRTIPEGAQVSTDVQNVYYRTVNGTAIGGTVAGTGHFTHVGGEGVFLAFTSSDGDGSEKAFTVSDETSQPTYDLYGISAKTLANTYSNGTTRYYTVELYKVVNTEDADNPGVIGTWYSARQDITGAGIVVPGGFYTQVTQATDQGDNAITPETDSDYNEYHQVFASDYIVDGVAYTTMKSYFVATTNNTDLQFRFRANCKDLSDAYTWLWFHVDDVPQGGAIQQDYSGTETGYSYPSADTFYNYTPDWNNIKIKYDCSGTRPNESRINWPDYYFRVNDTREPVQVGLAPLAEGQYKQGDTISLSVVYDEVIGSVSNLSLGTISGLSLSNVTYVGGVGTNVIHFTATLTADYTVSNTSLTTAKPVVGTVLDMAN